MRISRWSAITSHWAKAFWSVALGLAGGLYFREDVVESIVSTPHPALVYAIFTAFGGAVLMLGAALSHFVREEGLAIALAAAPREHRAQVLAGRRWQTDLQPVYNLLVNADHMATRMRQAAVEHELDAVEEHLFARLALPTYIGGALVGLGLVGTFIGLLGTLADLGTLFAALAQTSGNDSDPIAMFSEMITRLQAPMRGMGTAFVASLYGLMGSLLVGLIVYSVRRTGMRVVVRVRSLMEQEIYGRAGGQGLQRQLDDALATADAWRSLFEELRRERAELSTAVHGLATQLQQMGGLDQRVHLLGQDIRDGLSHVADRLVQTLQAPQATARPEAPVAATGSLWRHPTLSAAVGATVGGLVVLTLTGPSRPEDGTASVAGVVAEQGVRPNAPIPAPVSAPVAMEAAKEDAAPAPTESAAPRTRTVVLEAGQTLSDVAMDWGVTLKALLEVNPQISQPDRIKAGQRIQVPEATRRKKAPASR